MNALRRRLSATALQQLGAASAELVAGADLSQYAPLADNWSDFDICWEIIYPRVTSDDAEALNVKNELLECVWQSCSAKRGILAAYPALRSVHNTHDLLAEVVMKIFSSETPYPSFLGYSAFCNLVYWRMNKHAIALTRKASHFENNEEISAEVACTDVSPAENQATRLANLVSCLPSMDQLLLEDYNNKRPFLEMSTRYNSSEIALRKRVQCLVDHLASEV